MADQEPEDIWRAFRKMTEIVIAKNLRDPDLSEQSADYHSGYARGFTEATLGHVLSRLRKSEPASVREP